MARDLYRRVRRVDRIGLAMRVEPGMKAKTKARLRRLARKIAKQQVYEKPHVTARECISRAWVLLITK